MASPHSVSPTLGTKLNEVYAAGTRGTHNLGAQVWGDDGRRYVFAQANASIPASTAVCTVNPTTFLATASGGTYGSPATALVSGDRAWFSAPSV